MAPQDAPPGLSLSLVDGDGDVEVWRAVSLAELDHDDARALLSVDERARASGYRRAEDAREFVACRAILRRLLGGYLGADPRTLRFGYNRHGKPRLEGHGAGSIRFSVAHSAGAALFAFARGRRVGVDLERVRDLRIAEVARQFLSPHEAGALGALPEAEQPAAFYRCWTRKEAYLKGKGVGLSAPLDSFAVSVAPGESRALMWSGLDPGDAARWSFSEPAGLDGYAAAVACESAPPGSAP